MQLAQLNVARLVAPLDDPRIAGFVAQLDAINQLAENSPGFVWRLKSESGNATDVAFSDDPLLIVNMSVWQSIEALQAFTYQTAHVNVLRQRRDWFEKPTLPHGALWWVADGDQPTVAEARHRLEHLQQHGATPHAFWFSKTFPAVL